MNENEPLLRFEFKLRPLADVRAAPGNGDDPPELNWFGLTDGWFWIQAGDTTELFRYTPFALRYEEPTTPPYEACPVARQWEALLEMLPTVLDPLPRDLAKRVENGPEWEAWQEDRAARTWRTRDAALRWWWQRAWRAGGSPYPPRVWLWQPDDTAVCLRWDNRDVIWHGQPVWEASAGEIRLPVIDFVAAVQSFNNRFIAAMEERISEIQTQGPRPEVALDVPALVREQAQRAEELSNAWSRIPARDFEWGVVRDALALLDGRI